MELRPRAAQASQTSPDAQVVPSRALSATHERFWAAARAKLGDGSGTRTLIGVVLLQRRMAADVVVAAMESALGIGSVDPEVVAKDHRNPALSITEIPQVTWGVGGVI